MEEPAQLDALGCGEDAHRSDLEAHRPFRGLLVRAARRLELLDVGTVLFGKPGIELGEKLSGLIDFYFACTDAMAYDLAVTHAAWSFDRAGARFDEGIGRALVEGYETVRPLEESEAETAFGAMLVENSWRYQLPIIVAITHNTAARAPHLLLRFQ